MKLSFEYLIALDNNKELKKFNNNELEFTLNSHTDKNLRMFLRNEGVRGYSKYKKKADLVKFIIDLVREDKQLTIEDMVEQTKKAIEQLALPEPVNIDKLKTKLRKNSLKAYYFTQIWDKDKLKKRFRELSKILHPDMKSGNSDAFDEMKKEYDVRRKIIGYSRIDLKKVYEEMEFDEIMSYLYMNLSLGSEYAKYEVEILRKDRGVYHE